MAAPLIPASIEVCESQASDDQIKLMSCRNLSTVYDALRDVQSALIGVINQPRCEDDNRDENAAGAYLESLLERMNREVECIVDAAQSRTDAVMHEAYERALLLIKHEVNCGSGLPEIAALAAGLAVTQKH